MAKNMGTIEGTEAEIKFVQNLNSNKNPSNKIWSMLINQLSLPQQLERYHIIRVTKKVLSSLNNKKVLTKADCYLVEGDIPSSYINQYKGLLDERNTEHFELKQVCYSGISVKRPDSEKYQILKLTPTSFNQLIGNYEAGAAASVYCKKTEEFKKNEQVLKGWHTDWKKVINYFQEKVPGIEQIIEDKDDSIKIVLLSKLKTKANELIKEEILSNDMKKKKAFQGIGLYPEPYPAHFLFEKNIFRIYDLFDCKVTTGSGRSKGDFTIVLKPV